MHSIWRELQFAFTVSFHILFPRHHHRPGQLPGGARGVVAANPGSRLALAVPFLARKSFAVNFGMGVVSGLVMAYQFGTNWSGFLTVRWQHYRPAADRTKC
ncbi:cytochrome ubiquinol oxidase subunit I [Klebsiella pneumoniae]